MAVDYQLLKQAGTTNERLRELFTALCYDDKQKRALIKKHGDKEAKKLIARRERDVKKRKEIEDMIMSRTQEHVLFALGNYHFFSAVDLAWDSTPINRQIVPLMLYAQKRINLAEVTKSLSDLPDGMSYLKKNADGAVTEVDMPKFFEVNINIGRSVVTRRCAAQNNQYAGLYPWFKFESRATGTLAKLRGEAVSQVADETCDQYGWRYTQEQAERDMMLYTTVWAFPSQSWHREVAWVRKDIAPEFTADEKADIPMTTKVVREGFGWTLPHPSRVFHDNSAPVWTLNTDSGCEYVGFWDVERYRDVVDNPSYFNRTTIGYATSYAWLTGNSAYFNQYYTTLRPPPAVDPASGEMSGGNDRKNNVGVYTGEMGDSSVFTAHYYVKVKPNEWGVGDYPYPVWIHLKLAGDCTVIFAEIMPSRPCAVSRFNASDNRVLNNSIMHELMGFQDQLTNLFTQLLETAKADLFSVGVLNEDVFPDTEAGKEVLKEFKALLAGKNYYASMQVLACSFEKLRDLGIAPTADNIFKVVRGASNSNLDVIFRSITQLLAMVNQLMNLSPQEQGQPASHEISATESNAFSRTTESVFSFLSRSLDNFRAAQKRIWYESWQALGSDNITVPILSRYSRDTIKKSGFTLVDEITGAAVLNEFTMAGRKGMLSHDYIFTARDGADRANDAEAAKTAGEVLGKLFQIPQPEIANAVFSAMGKRKLFDVLNSVFRAAGMDVVLEVGEGEDDSLNITDDEQLMGQIATLADMVKKDSSTITSIQQQLMGMGIQPTTAPTPNAAPAMAG